LGVSGLKFSKNKFDTLDGSVKVRNTSDDGHFFLEASRAGVHISGELDFTSLADLETFAKTMADTWKEHTRLKPKIETSLAGH
jgi:hypothetical protein